MLHRRAHIQDVGTLAMGCGSVDEVLVQARSILPERKDVVRKNDYFVAALLVVRNEELASTEFIGVHRVK